jgi:predicted dehydrogenase
MKKTAGQLRFGIVGLGGMGAEHARSLLGNKVPRAVLSGVCDPEADLSVFSPAKAFATSDEMIRSGAVDAVLIATPHYLHTTIGIDVLHSGLHLLVEKPISVHKADCERLIAAHRSKRQIFAAMFNQRTDPAYTRLRELIKSGELGKIHRVNWIITNWFRSQTYYNSGGWRATWAGEGGGVLLNQCPHNLDLLQWLFGMPKRLTAFCGIGRYHDIEVEDDVTTYLEYDDGATGVFIASTGEAPGTNRLEITCERGRVVVENGRILWERTTCPVSEYSRTTPERWAPPPLWKVEIPMDGPGEQHVGILKNFVEAVLDKKPLVAPAAEGIHSVELANAMLYSSFTGKAVDLPLNARAYENHLKKLISGSRFKKKVVKVKDGGMAGSFGKA